MLRRCHGVGWIAPGVLSFSVLFGGCQQLSSPLAERERPPHSASPSQSLSPYVFGWGELPAELAKPRGGTTRGAPVTLAPAQTLPLVAITRAANEFERDRAAILALAGDFKVSFHFMETVGLEPAHAPRRPYHSWATEHVRVLEDAGRFISLQHTLVMFFQQEDGTASEPMLVKHWRQDWTYEDTDLHTYRGQRTWARDRRSPESVASAWSQAVFQVDDSPRYEAVGRWTHDGNRSVWSGESTWRPLPRREFSVRSDYDVLEGRHEIVLTPTGWLHVQDNWKRVAGESGSAETAPRYVAREYGVDRYERITEPHLTVADDYWRKTGAYWAAVRQVWRDVFTTRERFTLPTRLDGESLFEIHLGYADEIASNPTLYDATAGERQARETIERFLAGPPG